MNTTPVYPGFHQITRHDNLFKEHVHDAYKVREKLKEPTVCKQCGVVYHQGRWQWITPPEKSHKTVCPACHRIHDNFPAGFVTLKGDFYQSHRAEIMHLVRNHEKRERFEHPLNRIMDVEEKDETTLITTTDIHLARDIGEALHHAYHGDLDFHYNPEQNLLRVNWRH